MTESTLARDAEIGLSLADVSALMHEASQCQSRVNEITQTAEFEIQRLIEWREQENDRDKLRLAEIKSICEQYLRRRLETLQETDRKSIRTAYGCVESRAQPPEYVRDEAVLLEWARERGLTRVKTVEEIDWARIKEQSTVVDEILSWHGMAVPGVSVQPREPSITVKFW